jgi:hypothetical protein
VCALQAAFAQVSTPPSLVQNYFVTGDYVVGGWVKDASDMAGFATGHISIPDGLQKPANDLQGVPSSVPVGADIVAAYLYWATVESNQSTFAGQTAYFNGYSVTGSVRGNPNAPTSWSSGGCSGSNSGSKTIRMYRADVRPYLPVNSDSAALTYGATIANGTISKIRFADSGSNGNAAPFTLGATLVIVYRVLTPGTALNSIVIYDGSYAPSNAGMNFSQTISGFYQAAGGVGKITHIVANGQPNKNEKVYLNNTSRNTSQLLPSLYGGASTPPFPGIYGSWDNPTWAIGNYVLANDSQETTQVVPSSTNSGCVSWGAIVMSTTVQDTDHDGLLDTWESNYGYTDAVTNQWVPLPDANPSSKDIYVELDWLDNLGLSANTYKHTHLPQQDAILSLAGALANKGINVHFDLGPNVYQNLRPYVIQYPISPPNPMPAGTLPTPNNAGGNAIPEGSIFCPNPNTLATACAYPGQPAIAWKGGLDYIKNAQFLDAGNTVPGGSFQSGRSKSYHYVLMGHSLGSPRSYWSTLGTLLNVPGKYNFPQLVSIVDSGNAATVTIKTPSGMLKPGDCPNGVIPACFDANADRISISGALNQAALNGAYQFSNVMSTGPDANNFYSTTFKIATSGVADGTYQYSPDPLHNLFGEPQLSITYLGPTSSSGQSEFGGGGDSLITLGLWGADDPPAGCQPDPTQPLGGFAAYCANGVGTLAEQTGTLMHEIGHSLALTHGGTYFNDGQNPNLPTFEINCKPNYVSVMNYLFQVRGFPGGQAIPGGKYDYSTQALSGLNEAILTESAGIGSSIHATRWYAAASSNISRTLGNYATSHCDGSPLGPNEQAIRLDGPFTANGSYSGWLDWNNNLVQDAGNVAGDINFNGSPNDAPFSGYDDVNGMNLQQMSARAGAYGYSGSGGVKFEGGGVKFEGGGVDNDGGGVKFEGGGVKFEGGGVKFEGGGVKFEGGGIDQDEDTANSTADPPVGLNCTTAIAGSGITPCVSYTGGAFQQSGKKVGVSWSGPGFGQTRSYTIWRAMGNYASLNNTNIAQFTAVKTVTSTTGPPTPNYIDMDVKFNNYYTYFVTDGNKRGARSTASNVLVVWVHN